MTKETISLLVKGGAATAGPPLGPALAGKGINIGQVVKDINEKTSALKGMDAPVKVIVDLDAKSYTIEVGLPPSAALLKKEAGIETGSGTSGKKPSGALKIEHIIKIAKMKSENTLANNTKNQILELLGTCVSLGMKVEGKNPKEVQKDVKQGVYDKKISSGKIELTVEEQASWDEEKANVKRELENIEKAAAQAAAAAQSETSPTAAGTEAAAGTPAVAAPAKEEKKPEKKKAERKMR